ncbi:MULTISPECIES: O-acetyl-ADP-ribose deacetylase [Actinomycetes]|uniref:O-acetyl-ADP-ribose deacetylase n=2 Tax=Actinomycetes TaxID=1760 RepID=A0ABP6M186_9MICC
MRITVVDGDITEQDVDAIVNAANSSLLGGGGVDGAIHRAAGPELLQHCRTLRAHHWPEGLPPGRAASTPAAQLPADWVIHTVGPNRHAGETDPSVLASCFRESLLEALRLGATSVAFPGIGAGVYGWEADDVAQAARLALTEVPGRWDALEEVRFVLFSATVADAFREHLSDLFA